MLSDYMLVSAHMTNDVAINFNHSVSLLWYLWMCVCVCVCVYKNDGKTVRYDEMQTICIYVNMQTHSHTLDIGFDFPQLRWIFN